MHADRNDTDAAAQPAEEKKSLDFIRTAIEEDLRANRFDGRVMTRFPPEPNGYLHIGHAKSICLNFGVAQEYNGLCNLRFDDTNPSKEEVEYVESIKTDVRWLGADWEDRLYYASDYFPKIYDYAVQLIEMGKAYVCRLTQEQVRETRGTLTKPGQNSPYRDRSIGNVVGVSVANRQRSSKQVLAATADAAQFGTRPPDGRDLLAAHVDIESMLSRLEAMLCR
jgi:glutamyl/glutaminyl-tRNA synthetase